MICLPATIDNNIPNSELSVGADSALNLIVDSIDRVRQAATASRRCFVVETMGGRCGYLALLGGLSGGAVRVYLHEEGVTLTPISAQRVGRKIERAGWSGLDPLCLVEWADSTFSHQGFSRRY